MTEDLRLQNPFHPRPERRTIGDRDPRKIYLSVGNALTSWENSEISFSYLFNAIVRPQIVSESVRRAYGAMSTVRGRKEMIEASAAVFFDKFPNAELERKLRNLMKLYNDAAARRNDIAHGNVQSWGAEKGWFLEANMYGNKRDVSRRNAVYAYTSEQIDEFSRSFSALVGQANAMNDALKAHYRASPAKQRDRY